MQKEENASLATSRLDPTRVAQGARLCYAFPVRRLAVALVLLGSLAACERLTPEQCQRVCWRYNELSYWERFEAEAAGRPAGERAELRAKWEKDWSAMVARTFDPGLENCVRECRHAAKPDDIGCVERARTSQEVADCLD